MATQDFESGPDRHDSISDELESMRQIAKALDALHDDTTRQRVLQWMSERYRCRDIGATPAPQTAAVMRSATADPVLVVGELEDLFDPAADKSTAAARTPWPESGAGVERKLKDFVADFRRFALEWQGA